MTVSSKKNLLFSKNISKDKFYAGVGAPVFTVLDDNLSDSYHEMKEWEDWKDWSPNSWGY